MEQGKQSSTIQPVGDRQISIEENLALLADTPPRLASLTAGLTPAQLVRPPGPDEWSARDILAHLRACADMWGKYILVILQEEHPTIRVMNPRTWIKQTDYLALEFQTLLHSFTTQRNGLLAVLMPLPPEAWSRAATITGAGKPLERTMQSYARSLAIHERSHIKQIGRIVSALGKE